jgi:hypothetical protein
MGHKLINAPQGGFWVQRNINMAESLQFSIVVHHSLSRNAIFVKKN